MDVSYDNDDPNYKPYDGSTPELNRVKQQAATERALNQSTATRDAQHLYEITDRLSSIIGQIATDLQNASNYTFCEADKVILPTIERDLERIAKRVRIVKLDNQVLLAKQNVERCEKMRDEAINIMDRGIWNG